LAIDSRLLDRLYRQADAERWHVSREEFADALEASAARAFGASAPTAAELDRYLNGLRLEDLALACACASGSEPAWDHFVVEFRPVLYRAADALDPNGGARDLADSLYGELFGLKERGGERQSLLRHFHGRSSLATWLRTVLSQRYVDRWRSTRHADPLPEDDQLESLTAVQQETHPHRRRYLTLIEGALQRALERLAARDRFRLACYYAQEMTLAETARLLREHEATSSRQLAKTRRVIRDDIERQLREARLSEAQISECFASVSENAGPLNIQDMLAAAERKEVGG
jgi:RNA polymerase sigma-70 factor, ECF subfamily